MSKNQRVKNRKGRETSRTSRRKPRDGGLKKKMKTGSISNERKLQERGTLLTEDLSSDVLIWKAVGKVGKQIHSPRCLKSPFEKERG